MKHTKESWSLRRNNYTQVVGINTPDGWYPLFSDKGNNRNGYNDRHFANARTMVAAPDLLEACQAMVEFGTAYMNKEYNWQEKLDYADRLSRFAIAKVEGRE